MMRDPDERAGLNYAIAEHLGWHYDSLTATWTTPDGTEASPPDYMAIIEAAEKCG